MSSHVIFTSVNLDYLSRAKILADSIKYYNSKINFVVILSEPNLEITTAEIDLILKNCNSIDEILLLKDLSLEINRAVQNLQVTEVCTTVKAETMIKLLNREQVQFVTYIDPDIVVYDDIDRILHEHKQGDILLTPHLIEEPLREISVLNNEIAGAMQHGIFNLGFISCKKSNNAFALLNWWNSRLLKYCREDANNSIWTDQKWFDLAPVYFDGIKIVKDRAWNMASWNLDERRLISVDPPTLEDNRQLLFYHFSKAPSKGFLKSVKQGLYNENVLKLAWNYTNLLKALSNIDELANQIKKQCHISGRIRKSKKRINPLYLLRKIPFLIGIIRRNRYLYSLALKFNDYYLSREKNSFDTKSDILEKLVIDEIYLTHSGGGGVSTLVKNYMLQNYRESSYGFITPITKNTFKIEALDKVYYSGKINSNECQRIIAKSTALTVHHLLGNELLSKAISTHKNLEIYIHDRYFLSQFPFSDTLNFVDVTEDYRGINTPLNPTIKVSSDVIWHSQSRKILTNAKKVYFPNIDLQLEFERQIPSNNYQIIPWDVGQTYNEHLQLESMTRINASLNVVVLGAPGPHKGIDKVIDLARYFSGNQINAVISLFGELDFISDQKISKHENIIHFGQIERYRVINYLKSRHNNLVGLIPSNTRESYSLAFSDFKNSNVKFAATNHGALKLRGEECEECYLYEPSASIKDIANLLLSINEGQI
jgi:hypothetical protein